MKMTQAGDSSGFCRNWNILPILHDFEIPKNVSFINYNYLYSWVSAQDFPSVSPLY